MQKYWLLSALFFINLFVQAQTFTGTGGSVPGSSMVQTCFPITVTGVGNINDISNGLASVCINITHPNTDELEIVLKAPDGTVVPLTVQNGGSNNNYTNTCFSNSAATSIKFAPSPFTGSFISEGYLGSVNNGQNANGVWNLCVQDRRNGGNSGSLSNWNLTFSNTPAKLPPSFPACANTLPVGSSCSNATAVCDFNGLCGNTSGSNIQDWPGSGLNNSCFGLQNNSFIKFIASASTATFSVWVPTNTGGALGGIQMLFFSGTCNSGSVTTHGCYPHIYPYPNASTPLATIIAASGLTPGNTYYLMFDGFNNDIASFRVAANSGVNLLNITPSAPSICEGGSVNLVGSGSDGTYNWSPPAGLNTTTGQNVTASPAATSTYTLSSVTSSGCNLSLDVTVTVNAPPVVTAHPNTDTQRVCQNGTVTPYTIAATAGSGTITNYQWYINTFPSYFGAALFPPATTATFTPSAASIGTLYFFCKVTNSNGCLDTSNISGAFIVSAPPATPTATATLQPTCLAPTGTITVTAPLGTSIQYSAGGAYQTSGIFTNLAPGSYNITTKDTVTGCISLPRTVVINNLPPGPVLPTGSVTVQPTCLAPTGSIGITAPLGAGIVYSIGGAYQSGTSFANLANGTTYAITAKDNSTGCISDTLRLTINTIPGAPAVPTASITVQPSCTVATGTITITAPTGPDIAYSIGGASQTGNQFTGLTPATSYAITAINTSSGCVSAPLTLTTGTIPGLPLPPAVADTVRLCQNAPSLALSATGSNILWYTQPTGGTGQAATPVPSTATPDSMTYYVTQTVGGCESVRDSIAVLINPAPAAPVVSTLPVEYCQNASAGNLTATGTGLLWYNTALGGTGSATAPIPVTTGTGNSFYYVSQTLGVCESPRASIEVIINATPAAPVVPLLPIAYCKNEAATSLTATGTGLLWYSTSSGGTGNATAPTPLTNATGGTIFYLSQTVGGCESPRASITVTINAIPAAPTVTATPINYCENALAVALAAAGTNLLWYDSASGGTGNSTAPIPLTTPPGSSFYYVSQSANGCESPRSMLTVVVRQAPALPTVPVTSIPYCQNAIANQLAATGNNLLWYSSVTGGTGSPVAPVPSTSILGNNFYYVSQTINGCESGRAAIEIVINPSPAAPTVAIPTVSYCENLTAATLSATGTNLLWYIVGIGGTGNSTAPTPATTSPGTYYYFVSQTINGCESSRTQLEFIVNPTPVFPAVPADTARYCQNAPAVSLTATGSNLSWYTVATGGTALAAAPVPVTTSTGFTNYYVSQTVSGCVSPRTRVTVDVTAAPTAPLVNSPVTYCQNDVAVPLTATGSNLLWYSGINGGTGNSTAPTPLTTAPGNTFYYVTQTTGGCESPRRAITVTINITSTAVAGFRYNPDTICVNNGLTHGPTYVFGFTTGGTFSAIPAGLNINAATGNITLASSNTGTYMVTYTYNNTGCVIGNTASAPVTLLAEVPVMTIFSYNSPVCKNEANPVPNKRAGFTEGGVYTVSPVGGLAINSATGEIDLAASSPGSYNIDYTVLALGCRPGRTSFSFITISDTITPVTQFTYSPAVICITNPVNPILTRAPGFNIQGTFSATPAGLNIDEITGNITMGLSVPGVYTINYNVPSFLCQLEGNYNSTFTITPYGAPGTSFNYAQPVCKGDGTTLPIPAIDFTGGGIFSAGTGLTIDSLTGTIDLVQSTAGNYTIRYAVAAGSCNPAGAGTAPIEILGQPQSPVITTDTICGPGTANLFASASGSIGWYTEAGLVNQVNAGASFSPAITGSTTYYLTNTVGSCVSMPSLLTAVVVPLPIAPYLGRDTAICSTDQLILNATGNYKNYLWQDGSTQPTITVSKSDTYRVTVSTGGGCEASSSILVNLLNNCDDIRFPTAFSPNGDTRNEFFGALGNLFLVKNYTLKIFNRYGEIVFASNNPYQKWNGDYKGKQPGVHNFVWVASYIYRGRKEQIQKGNVVIVQ